MMTVVNHCVFLLSSGQIKYRSLSLIPQALINMGEILKAAGCDYTNGELPMLPRTPLTQLLLMLSV